MTWFDSDGLIHDGDFDDVGLPGPPPGWPNVQEPARRAVTAQDERTAPERTPTPPPDAPPVLNDDQANVLLLRWRRWRNPGGRP